MAFRRNETTSFVEKYIGAREILLFALFFAALAFIMARHRATTLGGSLIDFIEGHGQAPYQQRWLIWFSLGKIASHLVGTDQGALKRVFVLVDGILLFVSTLLFYKISHKLLGHRGHAALAGIWFVAACFMHYAFPADLAIYWPYDLPALLIATGLMFIVFCRPTWHWCAVPLIGIGAFNRETTLLLIPLLLVCSERGKRAIWLTASAFACWCVAYLLSRTVITHGTVGGWMQFYDVGTLRPIASAYRVTHRLFSTITLSMFCAYAWIPIVCFARRMDGTVFAKFWPSIFLTFCTMIWVGNVEELRIYTEVLPMIVLQGAFILTQVVAVRPPDQADLRSAAALKPAWSSTAMADGPSRPDVN